MKNTGSPFNCSISVKTITNTQIIAVEQDKPTAGKVSVTKLAHQKQRVEDEVVKIPFISASKIRGTLRRIGTEQYIDAGYENNVLTNVPMMDVLNHNSGGSNNYSNFSFTNKKLIRTLNPFLSTFGFSLALSGKMIVSDLIPKINIDTVNDSYELPKFHDIVSTVDIIKFADIEKHLTDNQIETLSEDTRMVLDDSYNKNIVKWQEKEEEAQKSGKKNTMPKPTPSLKSSFQSQLKKQVIMPGTTFYGSINEKASEPMNTIERGLVILSMEEMVLQPMGAGIAVGQGIMSWNIVLDSESFIRSEVDTVNNTNVSLVKQYSEEVQSWVDAAEVFLDNIHSDNIILTDALNAGAKTGSILKSRVKEMETRFNLLNLPSIKLFDTLVGPPTIQQM